MRRPALAALLLLSAALPAAGRDDSTWSSRLSVDVATQQDGSIERENLPMLAAEWQLDLRGALGTGRLVQRFAAPSATDRPATLHFSPPPGLAVTKFLVSIDGEEQPILFMPERTRVVNGRPARPTPGSRSSEAFNWPPGAEVELVTELSVPLGFDAGWFSLELPSVVQGEPEAAPRAERRPARGTPASKRGAPSKTAAPRQEPSDEPATAPASLRVQLRVHQGESRTQIESDTHALLLLDEGESTLVELEKPVPAGEGPLRLRYRLESQSEDQAGLSGWLSEPDEDGTRDVLVTLTPPRVAPPESVAATDAIFVIDTSGSMSGTKLLRAREGVAAAFDFLDDDDGLALVRFSDAMESWGNGLSPASGGSRDDAERWLDGLAPKGSTKLTDALDFAFGIAARAEHLPLVVVLTDGAIQDADSVEKVLAQKAGRARVLFVGIGAEPQQDQLLRLAAIARGDAAFAASPSDIVEAVKGLFGSFSAPLAWDLRLEAPGAEILSTWPPRLPDLYEGRATSVWLRVRGAPAELRLVGDTTGGEGTLDRSIGGFSLLEAPGLRGPRNLDRSRR